MERPLGIIGCRCIRMGKTKSDDKIRYAFDYEGCFDNSLMLKQQMEDHIINSWAIRAYWTMFTHDEMTLFSNKRLCENIGFDGTGVHCNTEGDYLSGKLDNQAVAYFRKKQRNWSCHERN